MCVRLYFFAVIAGLAASGVQRACSMRVYTSGEVEAVNGTDVRLKCTFDTSAPIRPTVLTITWSFRPLGPGREESVLYYHEKAYPPMGYEGRFRKRVVWAGDIMTRDASIIIREVKFTYNGTFVCQVKNPPDVHGNAGELRLRVVTTASFSELLRLALYIAGGIVSVVILLVIVLSCRRCRKNRHRQDGGEEAPRQERKDPTVCHPSRAVHLYMSTTSLEVDSSDGMITTASSNDPSSSEEEEASSDEEVGDDSD